MAIPLMLQHAAVVVLAVGLCVAPEFLPGDWKSKYTVVSGRKSVGMIPR